MFMDLYRTDLIIAFGILYIASGVHYPGRSLPYMSCRRFYCMQGHCCMYVGAYSNSSTDRVHVHVRVQGWLPAVLSVGVFLLHKAFCMVPVHSMPCGV